jgi:hypothetical protein
VWFAFFKLRLLFTRSTKLNLLFWIMAELPGGFSEVARQFCHLIFLRGLRSVTLRPTFSGGLPFSSSFKQSKVYTVMQH